MIKFNFQWKLILCSIFHTFEKYGWTFYQCQILSVSNLNIKWKYKVSCDYWIFLNFFVSKKYLNVYFLVQINVAQFFLRLLFQYSQVKCYYPSNHAAVILYNVRKTKLRLQMSDTCILIQSYDVLNSFHQAGPEPKELMSEYWSV